MSEKKVCCFTGHRDIRPESRERLLSVLDDVVEKLISSGVTVFRAGGAMGFDTLAALTVIEKKKKYPSVELHLFLPCKDQTRKWNEYNVSAYEFVLANADKITYTSESYSRGCMQLRNRALVNGSDICVAYCEKHIGGTAYTLEYAKAQGLRTINIFTII